MMNRQLMILKNYLFLSSRIRLLTIIILLMLTVITFSSCKKRLDIKPDNAVSTPETIEDLQNLLDYDGSGPTTLGMNLQATPSGPEASADNYFVTQQVYDNQIGRPHYV